jgi:hypothetical protein
VHINGLTIMLRARSPWEAADLGLALVRHHGRLIWRTWFAISLPMFALFNIAAWLVGQLWVAALVMWWLKPFFDRIPLFILSRAVFGEAPTTRETWQAVRRNAPPIWPWLLWRRLHPARGLLLPIDLLEGLSGNARSQRGRILSRGNGSPATMLTLICLNLEMVFTVSVIALALMFVPLEFLSDSAKVVWQNLFEKPPPSGLFLLNAISWLSTSLVEPFYVAGSFGLYLNRRTQLEGWDIELAFRRLAARLSGSVGVCLVAVTLAFATLPITLNAAETHETPVSEQAQPAMQTQVIAAQDFHDGDQLFKKNVETALHDPLFAPKTKAGAWYEREPTKKIPETPNNSAATPEITLGAPFGFVAETVLWLALIGLIVFLLVKFRHWLPIIQGGAPVSKKAPTPQVLTQSFEQPLPDDVPTAVEKLWCANRPREALAMLYRASVERLADTTNAHLPAGATESECLLFCNRNANHEFAQVFTGLVRQWRLMAYAKKPPTADEFSTLLNDWRACK